jgi:hypothetical protein
MIITPQSIFVSLNISQLPLVCGTSPRCGMIILHNYRNITIEVREREAEINHAFDYSPSAPFEQPVNAWGDPNVLIYHIYTHLLLLS